MKPKILLTRDAFRSAVFARDGGKCVLCNNLAVDAHHIMERRLWPDGGYYIDNGASLCEEHHLACERTKISVEGLCTAIGIKPLIPPHLYDDLSYDKWGNVVMPNGLRLRGELFNDESVQKALKEGGVLHLFTDHVKYPRTHHLPWSQNLTEDDRMIEDLAAFQGQRVIVTEKMDGENSSLYCDHIHARSVTSGPHISRNWLKNYWSTIKQDIPQGWRVCGENLWAKHSIGYDKLPSFFMGFSVWNDKNECLPWPETLEWFAMLGIVPVPTLYDGTFDEAKIKALYDDKSWGSKEGYVVRIADGFPYSKFRKCIAKFVRKDHVQTVKHWMHGQAVERNGIAQ